ncbi:MULTISPECIES: polyprenyl synthetase family protein [unclassified Cryobacterium]|uniref:polyprenyl synthetase family protein n=1 Tax=unclassified Cryobacterium TaxID=2649013 RepID=UPI0014481F98|nr:MULTISPECIES: polyprenyl synthetase family protein [unclassified Cryobacterium]
MDPRANIARRRATITSSLGLAERLFASADERRFAHALEEGLVAVEEGLLKELRFGDPIADAAGRYLLEAGGKRVRPALALLTAQLGDGNTQEVIVAAQTIEITHLASLYHDDVMDDAELRRGVPSVQTVWGNSVAILTGDLLFARAAKLIASLGQKATRLQAVTFERLCLGQLHETLGPQQGDDPIDHYLQVLADKTGSLIAAAAQAGIVFSEAPEEYEQPMVVFGEKIGVAFQLIDDVIDLAAGADDTGKEPGTDIRAGVATLPLLYLRREAQTDPDAAALLARIDNAAKRSDDAEFAKAVAELREHPVTQRTLDEAHRWAQEAIDALAVLPDGPVRTALTRFAQSLVERSN